MKKHILYLIALALGFFIGLCIFYTPKTNEVLIINEKPIKKIVDNDSITIYKVKKPDYEYNYVKFNHSTGETLFSFDGINYYKN